MNETPHDPTATAALVRGRIEPRGWRPQFTSLRQGLHQSAAIHDVHGWADIEISSDGGARLVRKGGEHGDFLFLDHSAAIGGDELDDAFPPAMRLDFAADLLSEIYEDAPGSTEADANRNFGLFMRGMRGDPEVWRPLLDRVPASEQIPEEQLAAFDEMHRDGNDGKALRAAGWKAATFDSFTVRSADGSRVIHITGNAAEEPHRPLPTEASGRKDAMQRVQPSGQKVHHAAETHQEPRNRPDAADMALSSVLDATSGGALKAIAPHQQGNATRRYTLRSAGELAAMPPAPYRVKGLLIREALAVIFGPSGSGKTFLGLDLAFAISDGLDWFGKRIAPCEVLYIALEGEAGQAQRVKAYRERRGTDAGARLKFITAPFSLLYTDDAEALVSTVREAGISGGVIVVDTFNAATPSMDENASADMGRAIAAVKKIRDDCGGLVILIHHTGKDATKGLRGHSSFQAALDAIIEVSRDGDRRAWRVFKNKDGADGEEHPFRLEVVEVGTDEDNDPVTSCTVVSEDRPNAGKRPQAPAGGNQRVVWDALAGLFRESKNFGKAGSPPGRPCLEVEATVEALRDRLTCEPRRRAGRVREALTGLLSRGLLKSGEGWLWCVD